MHTYTVSMYLYLFMQKNERQDQLKQFIESESISTQEELVIRFRASGVEVTQASVSRDIVELGIIKIGGKYAIPKGRSGDDFSLESLIPVGENLIVGKCPSGLASAVTVRIDAKHISSIVGTIAGDDTIFIAVSDSRNQKLAIAAIWGLFDQ